jgi:hypothetical protein
VALLQSFEENTGPLRTLVMTPNGESAFVAGDDGLGRLLRVAGEVPDAATTGRYLACLVPWAMRGSTLVPRELEPRQCSHLEQAF